MLLDVTSIVQVPTETRSGVACKIRRFQLNALNVGIRAAYPQPLHVWGELGRTRRVTRATEFPRHALWLIQRRKLGKNHFRRAAD